MIKFRWYYDKDSEEAFLNDMSKKGYYLTDVCLGFHKFKKISSTDYTYRIDLINDKSEKDLKEYIELIEESGTEYVKRWGVWGYFRKKGNFELYTDTDSQIDFYKRIKNMFGLLSLSEFLISFSQWNFYADRNETFNLWCACIIDFVAIVFLYQAYKANRKIKKLQSNK